MKISDCSFYEIQPGSRFLAKRTQGRLTRQRATICNSLRGLSDMTHLRVDRRKRHPGSFGRASQKAVSVSGPFAGGMVGHLAPGAPAKRRLVPSRQLRRWDESRLKRGSVIRPPLSWERQRVNLFGRLEHSLRNPSERFRHRLQ
jgi:hypothetical protein